MLPNEVFALECIARYAKEGLVRDSTWEFAHCPYPRPKGQKRRLSGDKGYWLTFNDHQHQGLLQSVDFDRRCFYTYEVKLWLNTKPPGYEGLYEIYNEFISGKHHPQYGVPRTEEWKKAHSERMSGEKHPQYGKLGAAHNCSKAIIAIKPDGTELHFGSCIEAARELGIDPSFLRKLLKRGKSPTKGKFKGCQFIYAT